MIPWSQGKNMISLFLVQRLIKTNNSLDLSPPVTKKQTYRVEKRPIKFGCHKPLGNGIVKPTPVALLHSTLENMIDYGTSVKKFQIIHNECAFSEEEGYVSSARNSFLY